MARWIFFGEVELQRCEAPDRAGAERLAHRLFGTRVTRVQSVVSWEAAQEELEAEERNRRNFPRGTGGAE